MRRYPIKSAVILSLPFVHWGLKYRAKSQLEYPIYKQLVKGSRPPPLCIPPGLCEIKRPHLKNELLKVVGSRRNGGGHGDDGARFGRFGVVIGPSGTGKSLLMREVCNDFPTGVLYIEIFNAHSCVKELAKAAGMVTSPQSLIDLALSYLVDDYRHYHILPDTIDEGLAYVLEQVAEQGKNFQKKYGYTPSFVLDGIDLLAKQYPSAFVIYNNL